MRNKVTRRALNEGYELTTRPTLVPAISKLACDIRVNRVAETDSVHQSMFEISIQIFIFNNRAMR